MSCTLKGMEIKMSKYSFKIFYNFAFNIPSKIFQLYLDFRDDAPRFDDGLTGDSISFR